MSLKTMKMLYIIHAASNVYNIMLEETTQAVTCLVKAAGVHVGS